MKLLSNCIAILVIVPISVFSQEAAVDWQELIDTSYEHLTKDQETLESKFDLSKHERWDFDQTTGKLVFSNGGVAAVVAKFQFVGSYSETSETWLWSWANTSIDPSLSSKLKVVREFGESNDFSKLVERKWPAEPVDGWEMAAISNYLLNGKGVYRPPFEKGLTFLVLTDVKRVNK